MLTTAQARAIDAAYWRFRTCQIGIAEFIGLVMEAWRHQGSVTDALWPDGYEPPMQPRARAKGASA